LRIILCGFGVVGQSLVKLFDSRSEDLYAKYGLKPRVVGVVDSKGSAVDSSGLDCDGQVLVLHDLLGLLDSPQPTFVRTFGNLRGQALEALKQFREEVEQGRFPSEKESYP